MLAIPFDFLPRKTVGAPSMQTGARMPAHHVDKANRSLDKIADGLAANRLLPPAHVAAARSLV
jgi:hypothetical protein